MAKIGVDSSGSVREIAVSFILRRIAERHSFSNSNTGRMLVDLRSAYCTNSLSLNHSRHMVVVYEKFCSARGVAFTSSEGKEEIERSC